MVANPGEPYESFSPSIDLLYGSPTQTNQGYAFYIVIDIENLGSKTINAQVTTPASLTNTILEDSGNVEPLLQLNLFVKLAILKILVIFSAIT